MTSSSSPSAGSTQKRHSYVNKAGRAKGRVLMRAQRKQAREKGIEFLSQMIDNYNTQTSPSYTSYEHFNNDTKNKNPKLFLYNGITNSMLRDAYKSIKNKIETTQPNISKTNQRMPVPPDDLNVTWTINNKNRIIYFDTTNSNCVPSRSKLFYQQMLDRTDLSVITRGIISSENKPQKTTPRDVSNFVQKYTKIKEMLPTKQWCFLQYVCNFFITVFS